MKFKFFILCLLTGTCSLFSQSFKKGDISLTLNYGYQNSETERWEKRIKNALDNHYPFNGSRDYSISRQNSNYGLKLEYALRNITFGISLNYWYMYVSYKANYEVYSRGGSFMYDEIADYRCRLSSLVSGLRINYFSALTKRVTIFAGGSWGFNTRNVLKKDYLSSNPSYSKGSSFYGYYAGTGIYIATTIGVKYHFMKNLAVNVEAGYDHGSLLLFGLTGKISTDKKQGVKNENN